MRAALALCHVRGQFLFQVRPDLFPYGFLCKDEIMLWDAYLKDLNAKTKAKKRV